MGAERRQHERVAVLAQVQISRDHEVQVLNATNLSVGGAFLEATLDDHPEFVAGQQFELMLCTLEDSHAAGHGVVHAKAKIVRRDPKQKGVGVEFVEIDEGNLGRLKLLVARAKQE